MCQTIRRVIIYVNVYDCSTEVSVYVYAIENGALTSQLEHIDAGKVFLSSEELLQVWQAENVQKTPTNALTG